MQMLSSKAHVFLFTKASQRSRICGLPQYNQIATQSSHIYLYDDLCVVAYKFQHLNLKCCMQRAH